MSSKLSICIVAALLFVNLQSVCSLLPENWECPKSRDSGRGGEGQRPRCGQVTGLGIPVVEPLANGALQIPCELVICLFNSTCQYKCNSELMGSIALLSQSLLNSGMCDKTKNAKGQRLRVCVDSGVLAIERCLQNTLGNVTRL